MSRSIIAPAERVTNLRWGIAVLMAVGILIVSFDWVALAVSGASLHREFGIDDVGLGYLLSAFGWTYALAQVPLGLLLDRIGVTRTGRVWSLCWGLISLLTAAGGSLATFLGLRIALGLAQAPAYPISSKAIGAWFPRSERSMATAFYDAASKLAIAFGIPVFSWLVLAHGWRSAFLATGGLGVVYALAFFTIYRDPSQHPDLTHAEKQYLAKGGAQDDGPPDAVNMFGLKNVWGLTLGFAAYSFAFYLLLTWLPSYFFTTFGMKALYVDAYATIPWLVSALAALFVGGALVDGLIARGLDETRVRKTVLVIGMLLGLSLALAPRMQDATGSIVVISIALAGLGMSGPVVWSSPSLVAPRGTVGSVTALMNCAGALGAIVAPIAAGYIAKATGGFQIVFDLAALVLLAGVVCYAWLVGRLEPVAGGSKGIAI